MKNLFTLIIGSMATVNALGQAALPTSWNFDDPQPTGWVEELSQNPGNTRYTNGAVGAACRLDGDDEYVQVQFSDVCGSVTYFLAGQGNAQNDVFTVEESADGVVWTDIRVFNQADLNAASSFTQFTDVPQASSRYIRWYFTEKQSGRNVGLDEIELTPQVATSEEEIGVSSGSEPVVNNATFIIGNAATTTFTIENVNLAGGDTLTISDMQITGPNASEFTVSGVSAPFDVVSAGTQNFDINFGTAQTGSRFATLTITNDDANGDETTFVIELYGIGGDYATEPTAAPTNIQFSNVTTYGYDVSFSDASSIPENYLVVRGINNATLADPVDGETYVKGDYIDANTQVVYVGEAGQFRPKYNVASTEYFFKAFSFNGPSGFENYFTSTTATASVTTPDDLIGNYYDGIDPGASTFLTDLQTRISQNYNQIFYSNYAPVMIEKFASRDTTDGQSVVTGVYSGYKHVYEGAFFYDVLSREHSWPHSWMPFYPDDQQLPYSDMHNLFPVHQDNANAVRSNRPLGEVVATGSTFLDAKYGDDANGNQVYEPRDQHKGDAARAIFYMATKWNGTSGSWAFPNPIDFIVQYGQDQDVLKQWHWQDPPDAWEIARNDFIESEQGNRNPFVDSVEWVCYIDFETMTYIGQQSVPCTVTPSAVEEALEGEFSIAPNPTEGEAFLNLNLKESQELTIKLMDVTGRSVDVRTKNFGAGMSRETFDLSTLDAGVYHIVLEGDRARTALKVVVQ